MSELGKGQADFPTTFQFFYDILIVQIDIPNDINQDIRNRAITTFIQIPSKQIC